MRDYFFSLYERIESMLIPGEIALVNFYGESSDFLRFNGGLLRQSGNVRQMQIDIRIIFGNKQASASLVIAGDMSIDLDKIKVALSSIRGIIVRCPDDKYINYSCDVKSTDYVRRGTLPSPADVVSTVRSALSGVDLAGIWASGVMAYGFANTLGQRNWHESDSYNFDYSIYFGGDRSLKSACAGIDFDPDKFANKVAISDHAIRTMRGSEVDISPGKYRAYLSPFAMRDILDMLAWDGFSIKQHKTSQSALSALHAGEKKFNESFSMMENNGNGVSPIFTSMGFIAPDSVDLVLSGGFGEFLVDDRSAAEFGVQCNGDGESPSSIEMSPGNVSMSDVLNHLWTGVYISNVWYCSFSDWSNCRVTGMTRFACYWVENGEIKHSIKPLRFDDSLYEILGDRLAGITREREFIMDADSYESRSSGNYLVPGVFVDDLVFTL